MRYRLLGRHTGLFVSEIALGVARFGAGNSYGVEASEARAILDRYLDAGGNLVDTSDFYRHGESERSLGELMAGRRNELILSSKFCRGIGRDVPLALTGCSRKVMVQSVEESLRRLKTDRIDLYHVHLDDFVTPIEETLRGLDDLISAGKIIYGAFSNYPAWRLAAGAITARERGWAPISAIQIEYNLLQRTAERELLPMADAFGMAVLAYSPIAGGLLTGKYRTGAGGRADDYKLTVPHDDVGINARIIDELLAVAAELGTSAGQAALAWTMAKDAIPIIGPRTADQLADNLGARLLVLDADKIARLDEASAIPPGYPHDVSAAEAQRLSITSGRPDLVEMPHVTVF